MGFMMGLRDNLVVAIQCRDPKAISGDGTKSYSSKYGRPNRVEEMG